MDTGFSPGHGARGPSAVRLVWIYPDLLSTYGDRGNLLVLARRARLRGIPVEIAEVNSDQRVPADGDIYLLGGGEDLPQILAARRLQASGGMSAAVNRGAVVLAVCAGYQIVGTEFGGGEGEPVPGLGLIDIRSGRGERRGVGEITADAYCRNPQQPRHLAGEAQNLGGRSTSAHKHRQRRGHRPPGTAQRSGQERRQHRHGQQRVGVMRARRDRPHDVVPDVGPDPVERLKLGHGERRRADQRDRLDGPRRHAPGALGMAVQAAPSPSESAPSSAIFGVRLGSGRDHLRLGPDKENPAMETPNR